MSLFDRWMSNLGVSKSSIHPETNSPAIRRTRKKSKNNSSSESDGTPATPSHKSYPSVVSRASIKVPLVQPSQKTRIVRSGPQDHRRRTLISNHRGSGDDERDELESSSSFRHSFERSRLVADEKPLPELPKTRSNGRFFQQGPLSIEQIRNLYWVEEIEPENHYTQTARSLNLFRQRKRHCDVRLITETGRLYAHKAVLVTFSQDLQNRLEASSRWKTGKISVDLCNRGFESAAMELVINWMYTGSIRCNFRDSFDCLFTVSDGLRIPRLISVCQKLSSGHPINVEASESQLQNSIRNNSHVRSNLSEMKAWPSFSKVMASEEFLRWSVDKILAFLSSDSLLVETELDVYKTAIRWLNQAKLSRIIQLDDLMNCVRWIHMTSQEIVDVKNADPLLFNEPLVSSKAAMGQWQRDLLRRGIQLPLDSLPKNRIENAQLRKQREESK